MQIVMINAAAAFNVMKTRQPIGLFIIQDVDGITAIDNSTGDAWTEDFTCKTDAIKWLEGDRNV